MLQVVVLHVLLRDLPVERHGVSTCCPDRGWAAMPTNDGLTLVVVGWPMGRVDRLQGRR